MLGRTTEIWIAIAFVILAGLAVFGWVPADSETPPIYEFRRQVYIGDAMLPMVAAAGILICAIVHLALSFRRQVSDTTEAPFDTLTGAFFAALFAILVAAFTLMFWAGPLALEVFGPGGDEAVTYRQMRASFPWKYIGYVFGGFVLVFGLISLIEGRMSWRRAVLSLVAIGVLILIFDVPFDTLLLPPNGDF
jgi:hypothetical protein